MLTKLIFIIIVIFSLVGVGKMFLKLTNLLENNGEILIASQEVNYIAKIVYTDYLITNRNLNTMTAEAFTKFLNKHIKSDDNLRDYSKDPWLMPYRLIIRSKDVYEIRSAGPDLEFNTNDDIIAVSQY